jgi:hypothetical protein
LTDRANHLHWIYRNVDRRDEQLLLRPEVVMNQRRIHIGGCCHGPYRSLVETVAGEQFPGTDQDALASVGGTARTSWPFPVRVGDHRITVSVGEG